jgi:hypothetical protein
MNADRAAGRNSIPKTLHLWSMNRAGEAFVAVDIVAVVAAFSAVTVGGDGVLRRLEI